MISGLVHLMRNIAGAIPTDVWFWGSIALTIIGKWIGLGWTAWLKTLLGLVALYGLLFCIAWLFPIWLQNIAVIAAVVVFIAMMCSRK